MQTLTLTFEDDLQEKIMAFLAILPKQKVKIQLNEEKTVPQSDKIALSQFNIQGLKSITDSVAWQQQQRDEWQ